MITAIIISIINIIINNIINVNCNILTTDLTDLKCLSSNAMIIGIIRRFIFVNLGFFVLVISCMTGNFEFKTKKKL